MNSRLMKFIAILTIIVLFIFSLVIFLRNPNKSDKNPENTNPRANVSTGFVIEDILNNAEREKLQEFVKNFILLYNTYGYREFSNLKALADYQTERMKQETLNSISEYEKNLDLGYFKESKNFVKPLNFFVKSIDRISVLTEIEYIIYSNYFVNPPPESPRSPNLSVPIVEKKASDIVNIGLIRSGDKWLVDSFEIE